jgi:hypothetical protein
VIGPEVVAALKKKFGVTTDNALAGKIGITVAGIHNWKCRSDVTARQLAELVHKAAKMSALNARVSAIMPVAEFFPIERADSKQGASCVLFTATGESCTQSKYLDGLKSELESRRGVYVFFDSRGQAIYTGKARKQSLWKEMNLAFNRERGELQTIKRVRHPTRNQRYRTTDEKARQIVDKSVPLHELASYFSAYEVPDWLIGDIEAMLVRSFANNLLNKRMERFGSQRRAETKR